MDSSQASAPRPGARLVAVRGSGSATIDLIDRVWAAGDAAIPIDPALRDRAARSIAVGLGAHELRDTTGAVQLGGGVAVPAGTALVIRTSGTTGRARGVVLGHQALDATVAASIDRLDAGAGARWLGVLPLHHVAGVLVVLRARAAGAAPVLHDRFDVTRVGAATDVTHVALVPTMLHRLLEQDVDVGRFARILLGGAAPPAGLLDRAAAAGARVTVSYGMTETAGGCVYDGRPLDGVAVAVAPDQRVLIRGAVLADGYRVDGGLTPLCDADGWFHSGDLGRFEGGRLVITGRVDDVIVTGGVNVSTTVVAGLLRRHPQVADAAVVAVTDADWGQRTVAYVVPVDAERPPTLEALRVHVRRHADPALAPRGLRVVTSLPLTTLGKVDHGALRAAATAPADTGST